MPLDYTFEKYKETAKYPNKKDFSKVYAYKAGEVLWCKPYDDVTAEERKAYTTEKVSDDEGYKAAMKLYRDDAENMTKLFIADLYDEHGVTDNPRAAKCYELAYAHGHATGYADIANYFAEFVELIQ